MNLLLACFTCWQLLYLNFRSIIFYGRAHSLSMDLCVRCICGTRERALIHTHSHTRVYESVWIYHLICFVFVVVAGFLQSLPMRHAACCRFVSFVFSFILFFHFAFFVPFHFDASNNARALDDFSATALNAIVDCVSDVCVCVQTRVFVFYSSIANRSFHIHAHTHTRQLCVSFKLFSIWLQIAVRRSRFNWYKHM